MGKNVLDFLQKVNGRDVAFLVTTTVLMAVVDVLFYAIVDGNPVKSFLILGANYMMALAMLLVTALASLVHGKAVLRACFQFVASVYCCLLAFCWYRFGTPLDKGMIALVTGTNPTEAHEFFSVYVSPLTAVVFTLCCLLLFAVAFLLTRRCFAVSRRQLMALGGCTLVGCCCLGFSFYTLPGRIEGILRTEQKDLSLYLQHPQMDEVTETHPDVVMIIIGESFAQGHCSLYGYDRPTNPRLEVLRDSGDLMVFRHPEAPATHTAEAFKHFMTTFTRQTADAEWYECLTLPEMLRSAGYHTAWFSNQSMTGWHDNVSAAFAKLCDDMYYMTTAADGELGAQPDGRLLPAVQHYLQHATGRQALFVHLMGQHSDFAKRYPPAFSRFSAEQYGERPEQQRNDFATYDNACLYNDFVVDSLFCMLKDRYAAGIYFSDHGLDFYESAPDYCSHANTSNAVSVAAGLRIPMVVYMPLPYRRQQPAVVRSVETTAAEHYNTEQLPSLLEQLTGYSVHY